MRPASTSCRVPVRDPDHAPRRRGPCRCVRPAPMPVPITAAARRHRATARPSRRRAAPPDRLDCDRGVAGELLRAGDDHQTDEATQAARERTPAEQAQREHADRGERPGHRALQRAVDRRSDRDAAVPPASPPTNRAMIASRALTTLAATPAPAPSTPSPIQPSATGLVDGGASQAYRPRDVSRCRVRSAATGAPAAGRGPLGVPPGRTASVLDARPDWVLDRSGIECPAVVADNLSARLRRSASPRPSGPSGHRKESLRRGSPRPW